MSQSKPTGRGLQRGLERISDLVLAVLVVSVVALLVVRVAPAQLDFLIAGNIGLGVLVLLVAVYSRDTLRLPSFPTVLLLATLLRLALNVSSTRLNLLEADAGDIIRTFGEFVVGGDVVVGAVVFVILTLIQFVVISKGAERIAEVSARFTLDAMPGKQMAIDGELRGGDIDILEAGRRRADLERESRLYGAMEGAMKFVKGDAVAGIVISVVNVVGGLAIGMGREAMSAGEAFQTYGLLTIGDGLVSQIPALLMGMAAGLVVTRVSSPEGDHGGLLAREILEQVQAQPRALYVAAAVLFGLGSTSAWTGFPALPFLLLGAFLGGVGVLGSRATTQANASLAQRSTHKPVALQLEPPIGLDTVSSAELIGVLEEQLGRSSDRLGFSLPALHTQFGGDPGVPDTLRLRCFGSTAGEASFHAGHGIVFASADRLADKGLGAKPVQIEDLPGLEAASLPASQMDELAQLDPQPPHTGQLEFARCHLARLARREAPRWFGIAELTDKLADLRTEQRELVEAVVPGRLALADVAGVFRGLLARGLSVADTRGILESLAQQAREERDPVQLVDLVQRDVGAGWRPSFEHADTVRYYEVSGEVLEWVREGEQSSGISRDALDGLREGLLDAFDPRAHLEHPIVLLVPDERYTRRLREVASRVLPGSVVATPRELSLSSRDQQVGRVRMGQRPS